VTPAITRNSAARYLQRRIIAFPIGLAPLTLPRRVEPFNGAIKQVSEALHAGWICVAERLDEGDLPVMQAASDPTVDPNHPDEQ
jgi:hypothetical protein